MKVAVLSGAGHTEVVPEEEDSVAVPACHNCGYDVHDSPWCPACGEAVSGAAAAGAREREPHPLPRRASGGRDRLVGPPYLENRSRGGPPTAPTPVTHAPGPRPGYPADPPRPAGPAPGYAPGRNGVYGAEPHGTRRGGYDRYEDRYDEDRYDDDDDAYDRRSSRPSGRRRSVIAVGALAVVIMVAGAAFILRGMQPEGPRLAGFGVGDCLSSKPGERPSRVDCAEPHDGRVVAITTSIGECPEEMDAVTAQSGAVEGQPMLCIDLADTSGGSS